MMHSCKSCQSQGKRLLEQQVSQGCSQSDQTSLILIRCMHGWVSSQGESQTMSLEVPSVVHWGVLEQGWEVGEVWWVRETGHQLLALQLQGHSLPASACTKNVC